MPEGTASHTRKDYSRLGTVVNTRLPPLQTIGAKSKKNKKNKGDAKAKAEEGEMATQGGHTEEAVEGQPGNGSSEAPKSNVREGHLLLEKL